MGDRSMLAHRAQKVVKAAVQRPEAASCFYIYSGYPAVCGQAFCF